MFDADDVLTCPACRGPLLYLGTLGKVVHLICRNCGGQWSQPQDPTPNAQEG